MGEKPQMFAQLMELLRLCACQCWPRFNARISLGLFVGMSTLLSLKLVMAVQNTTALPAEFMQSTNFTAQTLATHNLLNGFWSAEALIQQQGYPVETHRITTQDGYMLSMQRLPRPGHQPVLLVHGIYGAAVDFIILGRNQSLAYALWHSAYDVWLANCRGSSGNAELQRLHTHWNDDDLRYWNFSFHQIGVYDLPAFIDYVRSNTSFHQMHFIGYSQGATALLVLAAELPAYQQKLAMVQLLAPLAFFHHMRLQPEIVKLIHDFLQSRESREMREFLPRNSLASLKCNSNSFMRYFCLEVIFQFVGSDFAQLVEEEQQLQLLLNQFPSGGSVKQLRHFYQIYAGDGDFRNYDYDFEGNYDHYAMPTAPLYNLSVVQVPIFIHHAANDPLATVTDIQLLHQHLPNSKGLHLVAHKEFNHLDFIWAKDLNIFVNQQVLKVFND